MRFCDPDCTAGNPVYAVAWNAHGDALSVSQIDPATGAATPANRYAYLTWGTPATTILAGFGDLRFRYLYVGAADVQWDDTIGQGLLYMHARTYSPTLGRFLQPDPARADANLYTYAGNSPVTRVDPSGQYTMWRWAWRSALDRLWRHGRISSYQFQRAWWAGRVLVFRRSTRCTVASFRLYDVCLPALVAGVFVWEGLLAWDIGLAYATAMSAAAPPAAAVMLPLDAFGIYTTLKWIDFMQQAARMPCSDIRFRFP